MIIHKPLICITGAIPLGFSLRLIMIACISFHCAQTVGKRALQTHVPLYTLCIMYVTMFLHATKSVHLFDVFFG